MTQLLMPPPNALFMSIWPSGPKDSPKSSYGLSLAKATPHGPKTGQWDISAARSSGVDPWQDAMGFASECSVVVCHSVTRAEQSWDAIAKSRIDSQTARPSWHRPYFVCTLRVAHMLLPRRPWGWSPQNLCADLIEALGVPPDDEVLKSLSPLNDSAPHPARKGTYTAFDVMLLASVMHLKYGIDGSFYDQFDEANRGWRLRERSIRRRMAYHSRSEASDRQVAFIETMLSQDYASKGTDRVFRATPADLPDRSNWTKGTAFLAIDVMRSSLPASAKEVSEVRDLMASTKVRLADMNFKSASGRKITRVASLSRTQADVAIKALRSGDLLPWSALEEADLGTASSLYRAAVSEARLIIARSDRDATASGSDRKIARLLEKILPMS